MLEVFKYLQALLDDCVAFLVLDMSNEADAASVVLIGGVVQPLSAGMFHQRFPGNAAVKNTGLATTEPGASDAIGEP
jgi:hypothetical protein